ncbi:unnamed protein product [Ilex paraguariensis]|uniref:Uncharacterized protein n=1 Tax=Ilex paraguariensis TaxID=185542 RepID=A0ABC8ULI0_9AQUA
MASFEELHHHLGVLGFGRRGLDDIDDEGLIETSKPGQFFEEEEGGRNRKREKAGDCRSGN